MVARNLGWWLIRIATSFDLFCNTNKRVSKSAAYKTTTPSREESRDLETE